MANVNITINGQKLSVPAGKTILTAANDAGIRIPTLCAMEQLGVRASCKLCMVEIAGEEKTKLSCATKVQEGMEITTDSPALYEARRELVTEMFRQHTIDCMHCLRIGSSKPESLDPWFCENCWWCDCVREGFCELQALSREFNIGKLPFEPHEHDFAVDTSTGCIVRDPNKCVKCRRCVDVCKKVQNVGALGMVKTPNGMTVGGVNGSMAESGCIRCGRCVEVCPTGALSLKEHKDETVFYAHEYDWKTAALLDADVLPELETLFRVPTGSFTLEQVAAGLKKIGFDHVYSAADAADAAWAHTAEEMEKRLGPNLIILANDYAAKVYLENKYPALSPSFLFPASAQGIFGVRMRATHPDTKLWSITNRNSNAAEALDIGCVDYVMNARELFRLFKRCGVDPAKRPPEPLETLFSTLPTVQIDDALRTHDWQLDMEHTEQSFLWNGTTYRAALCRNPAQTEKALERANTYDVIHVIA